MADVFAAIFLRGYAASEFASLMAILPLRFSLAPPRHFSPHFFVVFLLFADISGTDATPVCSADFRRCRKRFLLPDTFSLSARVKSKRRAMSAAPTSAAPPLAPPLPRRRIREPSAAAMTAVLR